MSSNLEKDPQNWETGDEDATDAQQSYEETLADQAGVDIDTEGQTKAEASEAIEDLQDQVDNG